MVQDEDRAAAAYQATPAGNRGQRSSGLLGLLRNR